MQFEEEAQGFHNKATEAVKLESLEIPESLVLWFLGEVGRKSRGEVKLGKGQRVTGKEKPSGVEIHAYFLK